MTSKHAAYHYKICARSKCLDYVSRINTTAISNDVSTKPMGCISTLDNRTELRISDSSFYSCRTNRSRTNAYLDNICTSQDKFLCHVSSYNIACSNSSVRAFISQFFDCIDKTNRISISHI